MSNLSSFFGRFGKRGRASPPSQESNVLARFDFVVTFGERFQREFGDEYEQILRQNVRALGNDLSTNFDQYVRDTLGNEVTVRIDKLETGSIVGTITLILVASMSVYTYVSQYHDFVESLNLIRTQLQSRIGYVVGRGNPLFDTSIRVVLTRVPSSIHHQEDLWLQEPAPIYSKAFFWYLFISNILLVITLGFLLYKAVVSIYFAP